MKSSTVANPGGIRDLGADERLVVNFLNHSHQSGSQHWILEFAGARPGVVSISTTGPRVVHQEQVVEVSQECVQRLDELLRATPEWERGATTYCDVRLRRFSGADLVAEDTRLGVTPLPLEGCTVLMKLLEALPPTIAERGLGSQLLNALSGIGALFFFIRG